MRTRRYLPWLAVVVPLLGTACIGREIRRGSKELLLDVATRAEREVEDAGRRSAKLERLAEELTTAGDRLGIDQGLVDSLVEKTLDGCKIPTHDLSGPTGEEIDAALKLLLDLDDEVVAGADVKIKEKVKTLEAQLELAHARALLWIGVTKKRRETREVEALAAHAAAAIENMSRVLPLRVAEARDAVSMIVHDVDSPEERPGCVVPRLTAN